MQKLLGIIAFTSLIALATASCAAPPTIAETDYVKNRGDGYCAWCCLETICLHHGYKNVKGLTSRRERTYVLYGNGNSTLATGHASVKHLTIELDHQQIAHKSQDVGTRDLKIINDATASKLPIAISVRNYPAVGDHHAVILLDLTPTTVEIVDPNISHKTITKSRDWFDKTWTGYAVVVLPKDADGPPPIRKTTLFSPFGVNDYATPPGLGWTGTTAADGNIRVLRP